MAAMADRELETLAFHARVLAEALREDTPLLERCNFLGIAMTGLEEWITVRLGGLTARLRKEDKLRPSGMKTSQVLREAGQRADGLLRAADQALYTVLLPLLAKAGIRLARPDAVTPVQMAALSALFHRDMLPRLSILPLEAGMPLNAGTICLAVRLADDGSGADNEAVVALTGLPPLVPLAGGENLLLPVEDAVALNLRSLFPERTIERCWPFRVLRDGHAVSREDDADIRHAVRTAIEKRRQGRVLRLMCHPDLPGDIESRLCAALGTEPTRLIRRGHLTDPGRVMKAVAALPGWDGARYAPFEPRVPENLRGDLFAALRERDALLCHPFDSFEPVVRLLEEAARDRRTQAILMTLYRTGEPSRIADALMEAARHGVRVNVWVEPRARMDEERNLLLMDTLAAVGCRVWSGPPGVKVHGKALLVERLEDGVLRQYAHLGTGNYHEETARHYTDFGLLTARPELTADAARFFQYLRGERAQPDLQAMTASPQGMRQELLRLIRLEMSKAEKGDPCGIACMMNALTDPELIRALTDAGRHGVPVDLTVRGACCLIPGLPGETENITVRSVVGRFLEHGRVLAFGGEGEESVFLSSADWMKRSMEQRVELLIPLADERARAAALHQLRCRQADTAGAWISRRGVYRPPAVDGPEKRGAQEALLAQATRGASGA